MTKSKITRDSLQPKRPKNPRRRSLHDIMEQACGRIEGPKDLSTNRKHMKDFGK